MVDEELTIHPAMPIIAKFNIVRAIFDGEANHRPLFRYSQKMLLNPSTSQLTNGYASFECGETYK